MTLGQELTASLTELRDKLKDGTFPDGMQVTTVYVTRSSSQQVSNGVCSCGKSTCVCNGM